MAENENYGPHSLIEVPGVRVSLDQHTQVASLRYFDSSCELSQIVQVSLGLQLPGPLCAAGALAHGVPQGGADHGGVPPHGSAQGAFLAWVSPTETLLLCDEAGVFMQLHAEVAALKDACMLDQTGGACLLRASGVGIAGVLARMGGQGTLPRLGESKRSRLADVPVLTLQVRPGEILLIVERAYLEHVMGWIRVSATDLGIP